MQLAADSTPPDWSLPRDTLIERYWKKPLRCILYPAYLKIINAYLRKKYDPSNALSADQWYWGTRGQEYELLRSRLQRIFGITEKTVLVAGCGTGRDIPSWRPYRPARLIGVDHFNYQRAWNVLAQAYGGTEGRTPLLFSQGELTNLRGIADNSVDIVGSDAVLEHVRDLPAVLKEFCRVLKPGGVVYATFGPLWYCWSGDHISGYDDLRSGYNHLVLGRDAYEKYLDGAGEFHHSEHDGRTWIKSGLFSYLRPREYLAALGKAGFEKMHLGVVLEPKAVRCLRQFPELKSRLLETNDELDLIVAGLTIIFRKAALQGAK